MPEPKEEFTRSREGAKNSQQSAAKTLCLIFAPWRLCVRNAFTRSANQFPQVVTYRISDISKSVFALNLRHLRHLRINAFCPVRVHGWHPRRISCFSLEYR
jgi:hypothetical protein